jgi:DNA replication protein DnaC
MEVQPDVSNFQSNIFPFPECLSILEHAGQRLYGKHFKIIEEDHSVIFKLLTYFLRDQENADKLGISFRKGIILTGPIGCGKTSLMNLMRYISAAHTHHIMLPCRKLAFEFNENGFAVIQKYSENSFVTGNQEWEPKIYCFDDLGAETIMKHYGTDCNVLAEILLSRYDLFISHGMRTHLTTNLNSSEIEAAYGSRVRSRLREMMNLIAFDYSRDKRS